MIRIVPCAALLVGMLLAGPAPLYAGGDNKKLSTEAFFAKIIDCNVTEKDLAEKAAKSAATEEVRKYAQHLVKDHSKLNDEVKALTRDLKIGVVTATSKEVKEVMAQLLTATGKDYDRKFIQYMVQSHEKAIKMFEQCSKNNGNEQVRTFATRSLPVLREHLEEARKLDKSLNK